MKTHLSTIAALTATQQGRMAVLTADLQASADGWYQLLPAGLFKARDGRPHDVDGGHWRMDAGIAAALIERAASIGQDILIDYEHQALLTATNGKPAPASGWFNSTEMQWRDGSGLFIKPRWTTRAKAHIDALEYRFLSAVFPYDRTGRPLELRMAAITNDPGVTGMEALATLAAEKFLSTETENAPMPEWLKTLLETLGITLPTDITELTPEQGQQVLDALMALKAKVDTTVPQLEQRVATLTAQVETSATGAVDLSKFVPVETYNGLVTQFAVLSAQDGAKTIDNLIKDGRDAGKIIASEEGYLRELATQKGVAVLTAIIDGRPAIAALTAQQQTTNLPKPTEKGTGTLTEAEKQAARLTGKTEAEYLKLKEEGSK